jgi:cytidylate kinase
MGKHIITLGGLPGSGKSSTANRLATELGYQRFSSGDFLRQVGISRGLSVEEISALAKTEPAIDVEVDAAVRAAGKQDNVVIDSRLAFHWIPESFKVFLKLDLHTSAERTYAQIKQGGRLGQVGGSVEEIYKNTLERVSNEQKRYTSKYNIDYLEEKNYDLVIDTAAHTLEEVVKIILEKYKARLEK